ncbi:MAG: hypothetical protein IPJ88_17425 [Myxococcales bacterium]|nr:MAG: hypothetical protein IPJ88_17425 [Myxococcales bacterium]
MTPRLQFLLLSGLFLALATCKGQSRAPNAPSDAATAQDSGPDNPDSGEPLAGRGQNPVLPAADIIIELPYGAPAIDYALSVSADPALADIVFLVDTTSSFGEEIDAIQRDLRTQIIPEIQVRIELSSFAAARFEDFPIAPFGSSTDRPFALLSAVTSNVDAVQTAIGLLDNPLGLGGDGLESGIEALFQIGTGEGFKHNGKQYVAAYKGKALDGGGSLGGVGFRSGALHLVIQITDAPFHSKSDYAAAISDAHSFTEAIDALRSLDVIVIGIASDEFARPDLQSIALATGAVMPPVDGTCPTGIDGKPNASIDGQCPLVYDVQGDGSGLSEALVDAVLMFVNTLRYDQVWLRIDDDRFDFIKSVVAYQATSPEGIAEPGFADLQAPFDGKFDTFTAVGPATELVFALELQNDRLPPAVDYDQVFLVPVSILGDDLVLSEKTLRIVVPSTPYVGDAGLDAADASN